MNLLEAIWMIPLLPLAGAAFALLLGKRMARGVISTVCCGVMAAAFALSAGAVMQLASTEARSAEVVLFRWIAGFSMQTVGGTPAAFTADWGFLLDPLSSVMILVVTGIGFLIHVYSVGYMAHEDGYYRFFGYLNLFVFFMLTLVLANNYALLFAGWEGVGLCSYLLIGFYFDRKSASDAANKALIVNRVGDAGFLLGMFLLFAITGSLRYTDIAAALSGAQFAPEATFGLLSLCALLLMLGAAGKSAQVPLHVWLPDAMEGPTPVSALIHAATMVTAGVYMVARSAPLFRLTPITSEIVMVVGALTAILAASIALVQNDIKRVLAYSTVSQLGYMYMACGAGAYGSAVFHLYTHAFFKALLFLGAGSVIHALSGEQDLRRMGGLRNALPSTFRTMFIASLAIAGIPGLAGFFSKDEILWQVFSSPHGSPAVFAVGLVTAGMTAFYMWRLMFLAFFGPSNLDEHAKSHLHESPAVMTGPLWVLAAGSIGAGWIGGSLARWLSPVTQPRQHELTPSEHTLELALMALSVGVALAGIWAAYKWSARTLSGPLARACERKWFFDDVYSVLFVRGAALGGGESLGRFDREVVDGAVNGAGWLTRFTSTVSMWGDKWLVDGAVRLVAAITLMLSWPARAIQTGYVQSYALVIVLGAALLLGLRWWQ
jgi:NADH-quinone oxidoreductase subunit L